MDVTINMKVNGVDRTVTTDPDRPLLDVLREELHLTGTKYGCGEGQCGACSVLMDGERVLSCITPVSQADKKAITTIEGLAEDGVLHPIQQAFLDEGAMQCGYCTSGMVLTAAALLKRNPDPTDEEIVDGMNRNICRCNNYTKITKAVRTASRKMRS